jgi:hypothetical protein
MKRKQKNATISAMRFSGVIVDDHPGFCVHARPLISAFQGAPR